MCAEILGYVRLVCAQVCAPSQLEMTALEMSAIGNECCVYRDRNVYINLVASPMPPTPSKKNIKTEVSVREKSDQSSLRL